MSPSCGSPVDHVAEQVEAVEIVHYYHVERRARRALFFVTAYVEDSCDCFADR